MSEFIDVTNPVLLIGQCVWLLVAGIAGLIAQDVPDNAEAKGSIHCVAGVMFAELALAAAGVVGFLILRNELSLTVFIACALGGAVSILFGIVAFANFNAAKNAM